MLVLFTRLLHKTQRKRKGKLHIYNSAMKRLFGKLLAVFGLALALSTQAQAIDYGCKVLLYSIDVRDQALVFGVVHPFEKNDFKPSARLEEQLLKAARSSKHIEIRGRTDAEFDNAVDRDIAMQRALRARRYLISNASTKARFVGATWPQAAM